MPKDTPPVTTVKKRTTGKKSTDTTTSTNGKVHFESLSNCRDISYVSDSLKPNRVFRSARPDYCSENDCQKLVNELCIKTVIDLRSPNEIESAKAKSRNPFYHSTYSIVAVDGKAKIPIEKPKQSIHVVNFYPNLISASYSRTDFMTKFWISYYFFTCQRQKASKLICEKVLNQEKLYGMSVIFLESCHEQLRQVFEILANEENYPLLIHCSAGKDRTGLVIALLLLIAGAEEEAIIKDYSLSREGLEIIFPQLLQEIRHVGLSPHFAESPAEVMTEILAYIRETYGSAETYFVEKAGLTKEQIASIKKNMLAKK